MKPILKNCILLVLLAVAVSCGKQPKPEPGPDNPKENTTIAASQPKYYLTAAEDLDGRVTSKTAGLKETDPGRKRLCVWVKLHDKDGPTRAKL